jgi:hypothetical protein
MLKHPTASEPSQQSQDSSSKKPRFTDDVEDDISEAKEESETGTNDEDISE